MLGTPELRSATARPVLPGTKHALNHEKADNMTQTFLVATAGQGILRSNDAGHSWHRLGLDEAIEFDGTVRALAVDPQQPERVYAGADAGLCISDDGGAHWRLATGPITGMTVWSIAIDPNDRTVIYAGTGAPSRARLFKSTDAGESWRQLSPELPEFCGGVKRPRLLTVCVDPDDSNCVWFGVEEGGAWRSNDAGESWIRVDGQGGGIRNSDIHGIAIVGASVRHPKTTFVLTVNTVHISKDDGATWEGELSRSRFEGLYYTRTIIPVAHSDNEMILAVGDGTPGTTSRLYRSEDRGQNWQETTLSTPPNSTFWAIGAHDSDPQLLIAGTKYGDLYRSQDGGRQWTKETREFSEITAVAWTPFNAPLVRHAQSIR